MVRKRRSEMDRLDGPRHASELDGPFRVITGPNGGCSVFADSGAEVVSFAPWMSGDNAVGATLAGEDREFRATGARRLQILGRPIGEDRASVGYVGSSTSGVIMLGADRTPYRFRNPFFGRSRVEDPAADPVLAVRVRYFPRFGVSYHFVGGESERSAVVPVLGVLACLTVLSIARPSLHWTTLFAGAPTHTRKRLEDAMVGRLLPDGAAAARAPLPDPSGTAGPEEPRAGGSEEPGRASPEEPSTVGPEGTGTTPG